MYTDSKVIYSLIFFSLYKFSLVVISTSFLGFSLHLHIYTYSTSPVVLQITHFSFPKWWIFKLCVACAVTLVSLTSSFAATNAATAFNIRMNLIPPHNFFLLYHHIHDLIMPCIFIHPWSVHAWIYVCVYILYTFMYVSLLTSMIMFDNCP